MAGKEGEDIDLDEVSMEALNMTVRLQLGQKLNVEQPIVQENGFLRDYRGLAELMGFTFNDIQNFQRRDSPTWEILQSWRKNHTIGEFIQILVKLERYDIIDDLKPQIMSDAKAFLSRKERRCQPPLQDSEISSPSELGYYPPDLLTIYDKPGQLTMFDAYVCYADSDLEFVRSLARLLESPDVGIKLCIRDRDLHLGDMEYDTFVRLVRERCNRILIVISPDFLQTPECEFQTKYAASLVSEQRGRRLIPILYQPCQIPPILKYISKVDFSREGIQDWIWNKLIASIRAPSNNLFVPSSSQQVPFETLLPNPPSGCFDIPSLPSVPSSENIVSMDAPDPSEDDTERVALAESSPGTRSRGQKIFQKFRSVMGNSSSASSGFHSQSDA